MTQAEAESCDPVLEEASRELEAAVHDARVAFDCIALAELDRAHTNAVTPRPKEQRSAGRGLAAAAVWAVGAAQNTAWLIVLANLGFLLNAFNLLPIGFLDGGAVWRALTLTWYRPRIRYENGVPVEALPPDREHAVLIGTLYFLLAAALVGGLLATRHSGML